MFVCVCGFCLGRQMENLKTIHRFGSFWGLGGFFELLF